MNSNSLKGVHICYYFLKPPHLFFHTHATCKLRCHWKLSGRYHYDIDRQFPFWLDSGTKSKTDFSFLLLHHPGLDGGMVWWAWLLLLPPTFGECGYLFLAVPYRHWTQETLGNGGEAREWEGFPCCSRMVNRTGPRLRDSASWPAQPQIDLLTTYLTFWYERADGGRAKYTSRVCPRQHWHSWSRLTTLCQ